MTKQQVVNGQTKMASSAKNERDKVRELIEQSLRQQGFRIKGNRVVGATDDGQYGELVDASTLAVGKGVKLGPESIHHALRKLAGIDAAEIAAEFPLPGTEMPKLLSG